MTLKPALSQRVSTFTWIIYTPDATQLISNWSLAVSNQSKLNAENSAGVIPCGSGNELNCFFDRGLTKFIGKETAALLWRMLGGFLEGQSLARSNRDLETSSFVRKRLQIAKN